VGEPDAWKKTLISGVARGSRLHKEHIVRLHGMRDVSQLLPPEREEHDRLMAEFLSDLDTHVDPLPQSEPTGGPGELTATAAHFRP
jgi:hypothetical protein